MKIITLQEAEQTFDQLLETINKERTVVIEQDGKPIAVMVSINEYNDIQGINNDIQGINNGMQGINAVPLDAAELVRIKEDTPPNTT